MADETKNDDDLWGAEDPDVLNPEGHKQGTAPAEEAEEVVEETVETPEGTETAPEGGTETPPEDQETQTPDPQLEVARLTGELNALRSIYQSNQKPATPAAPVVDPVETLAAIPETDAMAKFTGLMEAGKYIEANTFWSDYRAAKQAAPAIRRTRELEELITRSTQATQMAQAQAQVNKLAEETKNEYLLYQEDMSKMILADQASQRMGNPAIFKDLREVFELCKARKTAGTTVSSGSNSQAKRALGKGPASGSAATGATGGNKGKEKPLTPEQKALKETWEYSPPSL